MAAVVKRLRLPIKQIFDDYIQSEGLHDDTREAAETALAEVLPQLNATPEQLIACRRDNAQFAKWLTGEAQAKAPHDFSGPDPQATLNGKLPASIFTGALAVLDGDKDFEDKIAKWFQGALLGKLDGSAAKIDALHFSLAARVALTLAVQKAEQELGATQALVRAFLIKVLDKDVQPDQFAAALFEAISKWIGLNLRKQQSSSNFDGQIAALRIEAQAAYDAEEIERCAAILDKVKIAERAAYTQLSTHHAEITSGLALRKAALIRTIGQQRDAKIFAAISQTGWNACPTVTYLTGLICHLCISWTGGLSNHVII